MADNLIIKTKGECRWDIVSLGEVMLRLDPQEGRVHTTRNFQVGIRLELVMVGGSG